MDGAYSAGSVQQIRIFIHGMAIPLEKATPCVNFHLFMARVQHIVRAVFISDESPSLGIRSIILTQLM